MEFDKSSVQNILSLNDEDLKAKISEIMSAMGADKGTIQKVAGAMDTFKKTVSKLGDAEIGKVKKMLGDDKIKMISEKMKGL